MVWKIIVIDDYHTFSNTYNYLMRTSANAMTSRPSSSDSYSSFSGGSFSGGGGFSGGGPEAEVEVSGKTTENKFDNKFGW